MQLKSSTVSLAAKAANTPSNTKEASDRRAKKQRPSYRRKGTRPSPVKTKPHAIVEPADDKRAQRNTQTTVGKVDTSRATIGAERAFKKVGDRRTNTATKRMANQHMA